MSEALSIDDYASMLSQADQPEQPQGEDSGPDDEQLTESEGQPEGDQAEPEAEDESEAEGEEESQDEQPEEPDSPEDRVIKWTTASGETFEATEKELQAGYMRDADYRQKTQAVAEERKQVQQLAYQQIQEVERFATEFGQLANIRTELQQYGQVNWQQLMQDDPQSYQMHRLRVLELHGQEEKLGKEIGVKRQAFAQQQAQQQAIDWQQANQKAAETLAQHIKGFDTDAGVRQKALETMSKAGRDYGFTAEELGAVVDGRMLKVLHDAAQWRALQAEKPKAVKKVTEAPKKAPPAQRTAPTKSEQVIERVAKARGNISVRDFAKAMASTKR